MKRKLVSAILVMIFFIVCIMPSIASANEIMPRWTNALDVDVRLNFNSTLGKVNVYVQGNSGVSNINATVTLYHKNWLGIWVESGEEWSYNVDQSYLSASESFTGKSGRQYKVELTGTVTKNGYAESISASATAEC